MSPEKKRVLESFSSYYNNENLAVSEILWTASWIISVISSDLELFSEDTEYLRGVNQNLIALAHKYTDLPTGDEI